jgi:hypothetical protein
MTRTASTWAAAAAGLVAGSVPGMATASPPSAAPSAAYGIYAEFRQDGNMVPFGPLAQIAGRAPPPYHDTVAAAQVRKVVPIVAGSRPITSLFVNAGDFESHVASNGFGVDTISAEADTKIQGINLALMLDPPPPGPAAEPLQPFLSLSARHMASTADFSLVVPNHASVTGSAGFDHLVVFGTLVNNQTLEFSGEARPNTVLYQSPHVTITLNQEVTVGLITCNPKCVFIGEQITTYAVDIMLDHANLDGRIVSGVILLGMADAE